ncbi:hypothetical protein N0V82_007727 [Gnomoniopsis sp. IMI 355080]|nr:hypothetical protein N0V82_007727 [Gnomoniopsis sp. IMI 355080]
MAPTDPSHPDSEEAIRQREAAAALRYAEVSLKSVPIPEGVDPNKRATVGEAVKTIKPEDLLKVHQAPCTREGLLTGIGSGAATGFLRYIVGASIPKAANWAVGSGLIISIAAYEYCQHQRRVERATMKRVVEVVTKKQAEEKRLADENKRLQQQQQEAGAQKAATKSWYKLW